VNEEAKPPERLRARNWPARASWISSLVFLLPSLVLRAQFILGGSAPPALQEAAGVTLELSFCCFPFGYVAGLIPMILGVAGLLTGRRLPGKVGQGASIAGILLGLIVLMLSAMNFLSFAAGFKQ